MRAKFLCSRELSFLRFSKADKIWSDLSPLMEAPFESNTVITHVHYPTGCASSNYLSIQNLARYSIEILKNRAEAAAFSSRDLASCPRTFLSIYSVVVLWVCRACPCARSSHAFQNGAFMDIIGGMLELMRETDVEAGAGLVARGMNADEGRFAFGLSFWGSCCLVPAIWADS